MLLKKKHKVLSYLNSDDTEIKKLGLNILKNNLSPKINVWFYLMSPSLRDDIPELLPNVNREKEVISYVRNNYSEMDDDSRKLFYNWIIIKTFSDVARNEPNHSLKDVYEYFK